MSSVLLQHVSAHFQPENTVGLYMYISLNDPMHLTIPVKLNSNLYDQVSLQVGCSFYQSSYYPRHIWY